MINVQNGGNKVIFWRDVHMHEKYAEWSGDWLTAYFFVVRWIGCRRIAHRDRTRRIINHEPFVTDR